MPGMTPRSRSCRGPAPRRNERRSEPWFRHRQVPSRDAATPPAAGRLSGRPPAVRPATVPGAGVRPSTASASAWPRPSGSAPGGSPPGSLAPIPPFLAKAAAPPRQPWSGFASTLLNRQHPFRARSPAPRPHSSRNSAPCRTPGFPRRRTPPADAHAGHQGCRRRPGRPTGLWDSGAASMAALGVDGRLSGRRGHRHGCRATGIFFHGYRVGWPLTGPWSRGK